MIVVRYELEDNQTIRVTPITDRHKRDKDFDTVGNFVKVQNKVDDDLVEFFTKDKYNNIAIHLGDVFDQGYKSFVAGYCDTMSERRIFNSVNGHNYLVVGNHLYIQRDTNPEFLLLQPDSRFPMKRKRELKEEDKVYKVVDAIIIGNTQISLVHYQEVNKNYKRVRQPGVKFHIALYHDDNVIPSSIKQGRGMKTTISSDYLTDVLEDVDLAVVAHWHEAIGKVDVHVNGKIVPMYIPGALAHTSTAISERHKEVYLPTFLIDNDGAQVEMVKFKTYLNELKFYESNESEFTKLKKKEARKDKNVSIGDFNEAESTSFDVIDYIKNSSLGPVGLKLYNEACKGQLTVGKALDITKEVLNVR